ncbi:MAG: TSUP family transporter [Candidatus Aegiribacteria sp.]|nr:TSUP family transporter [Candidatus Aegiribacteria sp.]MBD3294617.1 TSUP family transporter [Candidatus Fermentibacteria bacterium]
MAGFGYSLFSLPLLLFVMEPASAVPMLSVTSILLNVMVFAEARRSFSLKRVLPLMVSGVVAIPLGIHLLKTANPSLMKAVTGILVSVSAAAYLKGFRVRVKREKAVMVPVGIASGILNGATTLSGPPVILFLSNQKVPKRPFRASLAAYFLLLNLVAAPAFFAQGLLTREVAVNILYLFPAVAAGSILGIKLANRVSEDVFRRFSLAALCLLGLVSAASAMGG